MPQNNLWSPFVRPETWVRGTVETPLSIWDPTPFLSADREAFLSGQLNRACCFPFQMVVTCGSGALCFTKWFPLDAKLKLSGGIWRSECSPASLGFFWKGERYSLSLLWWTLWKTLSRCAEHRPWESATWCRCCCWYFFFPFLSFRVTTTWSAVLHRSRWTCDESHGYGFPRPAQFPTRKPGLPTPTFLLQHTTSALRAGGEILHVRTLALWPDCVRRRCNCKMTKMEGTCPFEHLLVLQVLSPSLPCTFPH